jgi:hypothetical protein
VGAPYAHPDGKSFAGKSYVVFGKVNNSAINLRFTVWIALIGAHNQIIQAIAVDIACVGD